MDALVKVSDLTKTFWLRNKRIEVLKGVDFEVMPQEMVAVVGPSGAGKSTLLHLLGSLDIPTGGEIHIKGLNMASLSPNSLASFRNRTIGFVFQFHHLLPEFTALENTMMPALVQRIPRKRAGETARKMLVRVGLEDRLDHRPVELSGGEQQRVALARALVLGPKLLLADEPTGNLDEETGESIHDLLFELNDQMGMTTIIVTHNPKLADRLGRSMFLRNGAIVSDEREDLSGPLSQSQAKDEETTK
ncbi:MAG: ABC transporter ATP-binding protein [Deltaproteobacteria bacterium]|nr:ABC transporter ATP-binding protein [Deltaproteobacteria bacterium]MBW1870549.1 ABC transporter ATP-binding protein [Deltaproteobacteria bacterium]